MRSIIQGNTNVVKGIAILIVAILITLFTVFLATGLSNRTSATGRSGEKIWRLYRQKDVVVLGINVQDTWADADEYIREFDVTFTNAIDKNGKIMVDYGVTGLPVTFFIDRDGIIIGRWVGSIGESSLQLRAEALENDSFRDIYGSDKNQDGFRKFN